MTSASNREDDAAVSKQLLDHTPAIGTISVNGDDQPVLSFLTWLTIMGLRDTHSADQ